MIQRAVTTLICVMFLSACAVSTAMQGRPAPDLDDVYVGADLKRVNDALGHPEKVVMISNGKRLYVYRILAGRDPSAANFLANLLMDAGTAGLWEATPPLSSASEDFFITYDENDKVETVNKYMMSKK